MSNNDKDFQVLKKALESMKVPILTLDTRWYELFADIDKPNYIRDLEEQLNNLMKLQGKLTNDIRDMKALKKKLMMEIMESMDTDTLATKSKNEKRLERNRRLIHEANEKILEYDEELGRLPYLIKEMNENLMVESMRICYERMQLNADSINQLEDWILNTREELKNKILMKQDMEIKNETMYTYMHDLLGPQVMEIFDQRERQ